MDLPYGYRCYFWKTSQTGPDVWIEKAKKVIIKAGGTHIMETYGSDSQSGKAAFMLAFQIGQDRFKAVWPVLQIRNAKEEVAAKRQAATMLYHDIKNKCLKAEIFGARTAFFEYLMIPDGRNLSEVSDEELLDCMPSNQLEYKK